MVIKGESPTLADNMMWANERRWIGSARDDHPWALNFASFEKCDYVQGNQRDEWGFTAGAVLDLHDDCM